MIKNRIICTLLFIFSNLLLFSDTITFSADNMKTVLAKGKERTLLNTNAMITSGDVFIKSDYIELYGTNYTFVNCEGNITVINDKKGIEITCQRLFFDRDKNMIRIQGNALMEDKKNEIVIKGGYIENWEDDNLSIIQIGVRILKKDMVCRSESARYFRDDKKLELTGMPKVVWKGDEYIALKINIDLENDEVKLEGNVKGEIFYEKEEKKGTQTPSAGKPSVPAATPGLSAPVVTPGPSIPAVAVPTPTNKPGT